MQGACQQLLATLRQGLKEFERFVAHMLSQLVAQLLSYLCAPRWNTFKYWEIGMTSLGQALDSTLRF